MHVTINTQGVFPKQSANAALLIRDQRENTNRFTEQSLTAGIPAFGGGIARCRPRRLSTNCPTVPKANSRIPRSGLTGFPSADATLRGTCIVRIRLMSPVLAADISAHNPGSGTFLDALGRSPTVQAALRASGRSGLSLAGEISDSEDCSAAGGIGLAVANTPWLKALKATTVRRSSRSPEEMGDNLILFGANGERVAGLWIDEAYLFPLRGAPVVCPVEFAANT